MAVVARRYSWVAASAANFQNKVAPSAAIRFTYLNVVDVEVNDTNPGTLGTLDEYMATLGYVYAPTAPNYTIESAMASPLPAFEILNLSGTAADQIINMQGSITFDGPVMPRAGRIYSISARLLAARTAGTATVIFTINGAPIAGAELVFDGTNPQYNSVGFTAPVAGGGFLTKDRVGFVVTTAGFLPLTSLLVESEVIWNA